jgi:adenylate cyclase, class 2
MAGANDSELEAKFLVRDLSRVQASLVAIGAVLGGERVFESNLRFDNPARELTAASSALRLRMDRVARLTFKGPPREGAEVNERVEIEFTVSDFGAARRFLNALGYEVSAIYEKYRTTYNLRDLEVVLDELPYGSFVEIEGPGAGAIRLAAEELGLRWETRSSDSYLALFDRLRANGLNVIGLTFEEMAGKQVKPGDLGLQYAD